MFEEDGKKTTPNASHDTFRGRFGIGHALRHKRSDMEMTKDYYTTNPPQVGDKLLLLPLAIARCGFPNIA